MVSHAINMIEHGQYKKIVWIRNNIEVKDSKPIGYLPGDADEKVMPYAGPLMDHIGGKEGLERAIMERTVELLPLGYARGRDLDNTIIICSEAENLTTEHVQLLIGRVGKNSTLWFNGDTRQVDDHVFEANSGIERMIKKLSGQKKFGYVYMPITERSETAAMADLLD